MNKNRLFTFWVLIFTSFFFLSCIYGGSRSRYSTYNTNSGNKHSSTNSAQSSTSKQTIKKTAKPPKNINIALIIDNWIIREHRILDYSSDIGKIRMTGKYLYGDDLVFKFKSSTIDDYYWLAKIPSEQNGRFEVSAIAYKEYSIEIEPLPNPPNDFKVYMESRDRVITKFDILDYRTRWGKFKVKEVKGRVMYLMNTWYPGNEWAAMLPKSGDGKFTLKFKNIKSVRTNGSIY
jgi:hypothetical protein